MSENTATEIDFGKYRRPELVDRLASLFAFPRAAKTYAKSGCFPVIIAMVAISIIFRDRVELGWFVALLAYGVLASIVLGVALATTILLNRTLDNLAAVLGLTLEIAGHVSQDVKDVRGGVRQMPSRKDVLQGVLQQVVLPSLAEVFSGGSLIGRIAMPLYRWTLSKAISRICRDYSAEPETAAAVDGVATANESLDKFETKADEAANWFTAVRDNLTEIAQTMRRLVTVPLMVLFGLAVALASIPLVVVWKLTS